MRVKITVESYELGDLTFAKELDDTGSVKRDSENLEELLTDTAQATRRAYDIAQPF